ncbi:MAG: hypothetical protein ABMA64_29250 [Myxococcota bacterium]
MRVDDPVALLLREQDPVQRCRAHVALGERAYQRRDLEVAAEHLREAADLDPTDEQPKQLLLRIASERPDRPRRRWLSLFT